MDKDNKKDSLSDMLNALADGQLPVHEREEILALIDQDKELSNDICETYHIKDLIQTAYPLSDYNYNKRHHFLFKYGQHIKIASYVFIFMFTLSIGYLMGERYSHHEPITRVNEGQVSAKILKNKVIVFLSSSEPTKLTQALYKAESLAQQYKESNGEVYVVTSASGIDLLNTKTTPFRQKIQELSNQYPSLQFIACNNTLYQLKKEGKHINLVEGTKVVPSAVDFVAKHLQQGWQYVTI